MEEVGISGLGVALPAAGPSGDDVAGSAPSEAERAMFTAAGARRWIGPGESLDGLMIEAARGALEDAGAPAAGIDRVYGFGLVSRYLSPNPLFAVHAALGLPGSAWVIPVATDFSSFLSSLALAREAIVGGGARRVLVCAGAFLSRHVHPSSGYATSIGDAACAAVVERVAPPPEGHSSLVCHVIVDCAHETRSDLFEAGMISAEPTGDGRFAAPAFRLNPDLLPAMREHGVSGPVALAHKVLTRNQVPPGEVTLIAHQASRVLMDLWRQAIAPAAYLDTYDQLGNISAASTGATLALRRHELTTPHILLLSVGSGMHAAAVLLRRQARTKRTKVSGPPT